MMKIEQFEAAGLDFDGTIANTRAAMTASRLESFDSMAEELADERYANVDPTLHAEAHHHGTHPMEIIGWVMRQAGIVMDVVAEATAIKKVVDRRNEIYWEKAKQGFDAIPGSVETVTKLHDYFGSKLSIVTTAPLEEEVLPYLERHGLTDMFEPEHIITRHDVERLKPDPEAYLLALSRLAVYASRFVTLEDAHGGIVSARRAGIAEVAALTTTHKAEQMLAFPADEQPTVITPTHADFQIFLDS